VLSPTIFAQFYKKLPGPIYRFLGRRYISYEFPRHIFTELTSACQLRCSYCPRPRVSHHLPFQLFKKIVDEASSYGKRSFSLHLFGEPLLYPRIIESIRYLKRKGHVVILTTNGILLGRFIKDLKICDKIIWSYKEGIEVPQELKNWKNFTVRFFDKEDTSWPRRETRNFHNYGGQPHLQKFIVPSTEITRYPCYHPFLAPAVRYNGDIVICCADPDGRSVVGNISKMTLAEAWKKMEWTRQQHLAGVFRGICRDCDVWKSYPSLF
jgi:sulfatase maturation enzyme AslB (radical SAM superfamily)